MVDMKISVIGAGAMGSLFGGKLSRAGNEVQLFDINEDHMDRVSRDGLTIEELGTGSEIVTRPRAGTDPDVLNASDVMIIFVKSSSTHSACEQCTPYALEDTIVVTLQNGVGNADILKSFFGSSRTAAGVTSEGATFLEPGRIRHAGTGPTYLSMFDRDNGKLAPFVNELNKAGFETKIESGIENLVWSKLIINIGINALTALMNLENGRLLEFSELKGIIGDLVSEAVEVAEAKGLTLTFDNPLQAVYDVCEKTAANRSSMLQDFDKKQTSEIDFINYPIVQAGEELGIATPVNRTISRLVKARDTINSRDIDQ
jgi:2-dehydropantoate 2-reductase